ncbi:MAG: MFS transporter [Ignavibacteria bacterium]|jgi:MFS family permease|nr:MFS transporter [Ignavibacteria bacterium]MCU7502163.1 MFS transporter [Ignavibacteria bacterium]MCU7515565.1 MFS transporter [Ignavibacteria bacterium]
MDIHLVEYNLKSNDAYAALRIKDFRWFIISRFVLTLAIQMQSVVVGWQVYALTHDALSLGMIGIAEVIPFLCVTLFAGHVADIVNRKKIIVFSGLVYFICAAGLLFVSTSLQPVLSAYGAMPIYLIIFITGLARGFMSPAQFAFMAQLIPRELFGNASTWNSVSWQVAEITGPAIGGLVYGFLGVGQAYTTVVFFSAIGWFLFLIIKNKTMPERVKKETVWQGLSSGLKFVFGHQMVLSALSLDMFAVFFGGAVSVLPIFADQVLHTGAKGLGFLRAAPALGAIIMSVVQAHHPPFKRAGKNLLFAVFGFGLCIISFALSRNFYLSLFILLLSGMFDNVSVVIRATIIQLYTPDDMRGRVSAVNGIFIGSSNELGSFESGLAARLLGLIPSVIFGGSMTLAVVMSVRKFAPKLRELKL